MQVRGTTSKLQRFRASKRAKQMASAHAIAVIPETTTASVSLPILGPGWFRDKTEASVDVISRLPPFSSSDGKFAGFG